MADTKNKNNYESNFHNGIFTKDENGLKNPLSVIMNFLLSVTNVNLIYSSLKNSVLPSENDKLQEDIKSNQREELIHKYNELKRQAELQKVDTTLFSPEIYYFGNDGFCGEKICRKKNVYLTELKSIADTLLWETNNENLLSGIEDRDKYINMFKSIGNKSMALFKDYELMSEIDSRGYKLPLSKIDINTVIYDLRESFIHHAADKSISVEFFMHPQDLFANINFEKTSEIIFNIFHNACKFTWDNGTIQIKTSAQLVGNKNYAVIELSDNGMGIKKELLPHMFQRFSKASRPGTRSEKTSGLGLYIAKKLTELQNGEISVVSTENVGTTFKVSFELI